MSIDKRLHVLEGQPRSGAVSDDEASFSDGDASASGHPAGTSRGCRVDGAAQRTSEDDGCQGDTSGA
jgi:hypothetical protein